MGILSRIANAILAAGRWLLLALAGDLVMRLAEQWDRRRNAGQRRVSCDTLKTQRNWKEFYHDQESAN